MEETADNRPRPPVSVVMPFAGTRAAALRALAALERIDTATGDELIVADNSVDAVAEASGRVAVVRAGEIASSYYARNVGADAAANEWLLFVDSDCLPEPGLLEAFFAPAPATSTGIVAGEIEGDPNQAATIAAYHRSRGHLEAAAPLRTGPSPAVGTANALVRRRAWEELGGFAEVVSGADFEFAWRAGERGWAVEYRPRALVRHLHPEDLRAMRAKARRYGAGQRWVERRYPGVARRPATARELVRSAAAVVVWGVSGRRERSRFKALDAVWILAYAAGWARGENDPRRLGSG